MIGGDNLVAVHRHCQLGADWARGNTIGTNSKLAQLYRLLLGQMDNGSLRGAISHAQRRGAQSRDRGNIDDGAAAGFQRWQQGLRTQKNPIEIGFHHPPPALKICVLKGAKICHTGVVDQNINPPQFCGHLCGHLIDLIGLRHIAQTGQGPGQGVGCLGEGVRVAVDQCNFEALSLQDTGGGVSDSPGGASDDSSSRWHDGPQVVTLPEQLKDLYQLEKPQQILGGCTS